MVGRLRNEHLIVLGSRSGYGWRRLASSQNDDGRPAARFFLADQTQRRLLLVLRPRHSGADVFHTGLHDNYHRPSDVAKLINSDGMTQVTRLLFGVVYELADRPAAMPGYSDGRPL